MFSLDYAGPNSFEVRTRRNGFAGLIAHQPVKGDFKVYFNDTATRGSARRFATVEDAVQFIHARRVKKGWGI
jgi:hypothetical protein